jgi:monoamine oxidase
MLDVLIIGAGVSGLYLAKLLAIESESSTSQKNFEFSVFEARDRIGGRLLSIDGVKKKLLVYMFLYYFL